MCTSEQPVDHHQKWIGRQHWICPAVRRVYPPVATPRSRSWSSSHMLRGPASGDRSSKHSLGLTCHQKIGGRYCAALMAAAAAVTALSILAAAFATSASKVFMRSRSSCSIKFVWRRV